MMLSNEKLDYRRRRLLRKLNAIPPDFVDRMNETMPAVPVGTNDVLAGPDVPGAPQNLLLRISQRRRSTRGLETPGPIAIAGTSIIATTSAIGVHAVIAITTSFRRL